jgi:hypothetical protein
MAMTPEVRADLLVATREAAIAFIEDMPHIREILKRTDPDRGEVRRLSGTLRRLLIDNGGDLRDISAPRTGRLMYSMPDNKPVYNAAKKKPYEFFGSAGVAAFGVHWRAAAFEQGSSAQPLEDFDPDRRILLPMDNFLSQQIPCLNGKWITRRDAIKYMANIASGVHSGYAKEEIEKTIARIRRSVSYTATPTMNIRFNVDALYPTEPPFRYEPDSLDPVLIEVLATAHFLATSPDLETLELNIHEELKQFS